MPKGDRLKLKADPEDGTTPIANLLLEAVAMAKISGLQKGAIVYLWRQTYGWVDEDGKRKKEAKITLAEWGKALDRDKGRVSHALAELEQMNIVKRRQADVWGGYYYSLNTNIASWNSDSINLAKLAETVEVAHLPTVDENATVAEMTTVDENATQQLTKTQPSLGGIIGGVTLKKEILNKYINKKGDKVLSPVLGLKVKEVFARLDKLRGYRPPKRKAEASAIIRMLKEYDSDQIVTIYENLKKEAFWQNKELFMMTVENQIGAMIKAKGDAPSKRYAHMVKHE